jgi:hypothetical protein
VKHTPTNLQRRIAAQRAKVCAWINLEYARELRLEGNQRLADWLLDIAATHRKQARLLKAKGAL